eukprot:SAG22_NODE_1877_length_3383_cov_2.067905_3_plen_175_part_00
MVKRIGLSGLDARRALKELRQMSAEAGPNERGADPADSVRVALARCVVCMSVRDSIQPWTPALPVPCLLTGVCPGLANNCPGERRARGQTTFRTFALWWNRTKEIERRRARRDVKELFQSVDKDGSGLLDKAEVAQFLSKGECLSLWSYCQRCCLSLLLTAFRCGSSDWSKRAR